MLEPPRRTSQRRTARSFVLAVMLLLLAVAGADSRSFAAGGAADGATVSPSDDNDVTPSRIRENYLKRYPYAKGAAETDVVTGGESASGSSETYQAYSLVLKLCIPDADMDQKAFAANVQTPNGVQTVLVEESEDGTLTSKQSGSFTTLNTEGAADGKVDDKPIDVVNFGDAIDAGAVVEKIITCNGKSDNCYTAPPVLIHYEYVQLPKFATVELPTQRDADALKRGMIKTEGLPLSDTQFQIIDRNNKQRLLELMFDPERWVWTQSAIGHMQMASLSNSVGGAAEANFKSAFGIINDTLINVANENAASAPAGSGHRSIAEAVYVVQRMFKFVFLPMAILFLLPGAILTQVKGLVGHAFLGGGEDSVNPFTGITRAIIAIFLIPATQLIVSYCIDIGNALTNAVRDPAKQWIQEDVLVQWANEQTFNPNPANFNNGILPPGQGRNLGNSGGGGGAQAGAPAGSGGETPGTPSGTGAEKGFDFGAVFGGGGGASSPVDFIRRFFEFLFGGSVERQEADSASGGQGKAAGQLEGQVVQEDQLWLSGSMQLGFNSLSFLMGGALTVLAAYQVVFMCYLFLLGPISACFFAWPTGVGSLFKKVFSNWLDAVVVLSLWRFYWCVILAVMTQRIIHLHPNPGAPMEMMVYNCFLAMLLYVPFQPFNFHPGAMVSQVLDKAGGGGGGKGGGGRGGAQPGAGDSSSASRPGRSTATRSSAESRREFGAISGGTRQAAPVSGGAPVAAVAPPPRQSGGSRPAGRSGAGSGAGGAAAPPMAGTVGSVPAPATAAPPGSGGPPGSPRAPAANAAVRALSAIAGGAAVRAFPPGAAPTVALSPDAAGGAVLVNTADPVLASAGLRAWQQAAPAPSYLGPPATGGGATAGPGAGSGRGLPLSAAGSSGKQPGAPAAAAGPASLEDPAGAGRIKDASAAAAARPLPPGGDRPADGAADGGRRPGEAPPPPSELPPSPGGEPDAPPPPPSGQT